jgi:hypothetical protein
MNRAPACILAIAGWYLLYPPAAHSRHPESYNTLSEWNIDGSYGSAPDCHEARQNDLNALQGLEQDSPDFLTPRPVGVSQRTIRASQSNLQAKEL